jgi:PAS domain S-box-containing protein
MPVAAYQGKDARMPNTEGDRPDAEARLRDRFLEHGVIDQAVGILIERLSSGPEEAFGQLLEIERRSGRDLLEVAGELVGKAVEARTRVPMDESAAGPGSHPHHSPGSGFKAGTGPSRLERSADGDELARLLLADVLAWSGAAEAAIGLVQPDGALELIGSAGLPPRVVSQWRRIPPHVDCLLNTAVRTGEAVWADATAATASLTGPLGSTGSANSTGAGAGPALLGRPGGGGALANPVHAAAPVRVGRGLIGAIEVAWPPGTTFPAAVRREIVAVLESIGPAVVRSRRLPEDKSADEAAGPLPDPDRSRVAHEARLGRLSGIGAWEWDLAAGMVHWSAEALMAFGARTLPGPVLEELRPYQVHRDDVPEHDRLMRTLSREARAARAEFRIVRPDGSVRHLRFAGEPALGENGAASTVYGTVQDVTEYRRAQTALEIAHIQLAAQRSRADSERQLADLLQQVIMPVEPARIPAAAGLEVAARYRPASAGAGVGGDWYGIFPLDESRLLLTVGDIAGHGFAAATTMAQLYHAMYGLALTGVSSAQLLGWLNTVACSLPEFTIASACCAVYYPAERRLCLANAGHPSPVLVRAGAAATLPHPVGTMLGVDADSAYEEENVVLEPGDVLVLYTDGLIERRRSSPEENTDRLLAEAAEPEADLNHYVERILARTEADTDDDTCILAVRFS